MARRRTRIAVAVLGLVTVVVFIVGGLCHPAIREQLYLRDLESDEPDVRRHAIRKLGELRSRRAVLPLVDILRESAIPAKLPRHALEKTHPEYLEHAGDYAHVTRALTEIGSPAIPVLVDGIRSAVEASDALERTITGDPIPRKVEFNFRLSAIAVLREMGAPAIPALTELFVDDVELLAGEALGRMGSRGQAVLIGLLQDREDLKMRYLSITAMKLSGSRSNEIREALSAALLDDDRITRRMAVEALTALREAQ